MGWGPNKLFFTKLLTVVLFVFPGTMFNSGYFGGSIYSTDTSTKQQRTSLGFGDVFTSSQQEGGSKIHKTYDTANDELNTSNKRKSVVTGGPQNLDPGCLPVTIRIMREAILNKTKVYGLQEACPLSLVGWVLFEDIRVKPGECSFKLSDGTGTALILMDIRSDNESWLLNKIKTLLSFDETSSSSTSRYLRIIGMLTAEEEKTDDELVVVRAIHIRLAEFEEAAFYHTLECARTALRLVPKENISSTKSFKDTQADIQKGSSSSAKHENLLEGVILPDSFQFCTDVYERQILKFIMKYRSPPLGVPRKKIMTELYSMGFEDTPRIQDALKELLEGAMCMETETEWIDLVLEDDV